MTYRLGLAASAQRQFDRLPDKIASAILEFMLGPLVDNPWVVGKPLHAPLAGCWGARRGSYRVIYRVEDDRVVVLRIDHRSRVYRTSVPFSH